MYSPNSPADLKAIEYGKYSHDQKCESDEVVIESHLLRENNAAVESVNVMKGCSDGTKEIHTSR